MYRLLVSTWYATKRRWHPVETQLAKEVAVPRHHTLALHRLDANTWLVASSRRERLTLLGENCCAALDPLWHETSCGQRECGKPPWT